MGQAYQLEESSDRYLLEDGSGVYLNEVQDVTLALTGLQVDARAGVLRADWHIESATGTASPEIAVLLSGLELAAEHGEVTADAGSPDREVSLSGLEATTGYGSLSPSSELATTGAASTTDLGTLYPNASVVGDGLACTVESGTVTVLGDITEALSGLEMVLSAGTVSPEGGNVGDDLVFLQRQRRFGKSTMPLVRQPYPRKVR